VRAVPLAVLRGLARDERARRDRATFEVGVLEIEPGVEHGDADPAAGRGRHVDGRRPQAPGELVVVGELRRRRGGLGRLDLDRIHDAFGLDRDDRVICRGPRAERRRQLVGGTRDDGDAERLEHDRLGARRGIVCQSLGAEIRRVEHVRDACQRLQRPLGRSAVRARAVAEHDDGPAGGLRL